MPSYEEAYAPPPPTTTLPDPALELASMLFTLARAGDTPALQTYVDAGIPKNLTNDAGDTLVMLAAYHGHADTVKMLVKHGADVNVLNVKGQSPIAGAVFKGWDEVVKALFDAGADLKAGKPNAIDCARIFMRKSYLKLFGVSDGMAT
ncbi:ankyrin repeat-containing domain protein [Phaeosphaeriaceae sp. PMI808]|nr:ankyrin repeat-containing domain protein [Phaeosphaeriaceae sp. PMI808]